MDINDNYHVIFTMKSMEELQEIYLYISKKLYDKVAANSLMKEINNKVMNLSIFPRLYSKLEIPKAKYNTYHKIVVKNYIIIYEVNEKRKKVYIIHIFYARSNYIKNLNSKLFLI